MFDIKYKNMIKPTIFYAIIFLNGEVLARNSVDFEGPNRIDSNHLIFPRSKNKPDWITDPHMDENCESFEKLRYFELALKLNAVSLRKRM